ncbi:fimbrial protein [Intestinirhabdus alba]|jgi:type 1 fimbria pilin|uniref:Fimbrial protein n=1 Tax=Intestinirhabdus alba TaxID=2899544 RepID=A0A6L6IH22_9ENTR|nr:fimbrial protein [Intestinirhabdus alba]MTH44958.1 fimbrial protein [Intestinirhabdus alba]
MKLNKIMLAASVVMGLASFAHAEDPAPVTIPPDQGHGIVNFHGTVIDAPCSVNPDSDGQTVELGQISNVLLDNGGSSAPKTFQIQLENCSLSVAKGVTTTFTGAEGQKGKLGITGDVKGAGIVLTDGTGKAIELGKPTAAQQLAAGEKAATLEFSAYLQGDGAAVNPGEFNSIANFMLSYQ